MKKTSEKKVEQPELNFIDFEIPLLMALIKLGGSAKPSQVYPVVEKIMKLSPKTGRIAGITIYTKMLLIAG